MHLDSAPMTQDPAPMTQDPAPLTQDPVPMTQDPATLEDPFELRGPRGVRKEPKLVA